MNRERFIPEGEEDEFDPIMPGADEVVADQEERETRERAQVGREEKDAEQQAVNMFGIPEGVYDRFDNREHTASQFEQPRSQVSNRPGALDFTAAQEARRALIVLNDVTQERQEGGA